MDVILFKAAVALGITFLGILALRTRTLAGMSERSFIACALALQLLPTLALFVALYVVGHQEVRSDVPVFYLPAAEAVIAGHLPYRDFPLSYGPLFPYVGGALALLWDSGKAFALFAIAINACGLLLWHRAAMSCLDPLTARRASILYATSGHLALQALLGTNQLWIAAALAGSALLLMQHHSWSSGFVQAVAVCATKFLTMLFWPVFWICAPGRVRWLVGAVLPGSLVYGFFALAGADVLYPLRVESGRISSGNLPYLIDPLVAGAGLVNPRVVDGLTLCALVATTVWLYWQARTLTPQRRSALIFAGLTLVGFVFMLTSKKSFTVYAVFFMYPAITVLVRSVPSSRVIAVFLLLFNTLLAIEPTVWFRLGLADKGQSLTDWLPRTSPASAIAFLLMELTLIACYGYLTYLSADSTRRAGLTQPQARPSDGLRAAVKAPGR